MLDKKSHENWDAADGCFELQYFNAAASRYYYALFQAVFYHAALLGEMKLNGPPEERQSRHGQAANWVGAKAGQACRSTYQTMRWMREKADYSPEGVSEDKLRGVLAEVNDLRTVFLQLGNKADANH